MFVCGLCGVLCVCAFGLCVWCMCVGVVRVLFVCVWCVFGCVCVFACVWCVYVICVCVFSGRVCR